MARQRQIPRDLRSLWKRAGERAGDGAGALFAQLDAQDARASIDAQGQQVPQDYHQIQERAARAGGAAALVRLAERIRAGHWNDEIAEIVRRAELAERAG
jgi:hypothetical protein